MLNLRIFLLLIERQNMVSQSRQGILGFLIVFADVGAFSQYWRS